MDRLRELQRGAASEARRDGGNESMNASLVRNGPGGGGIASGELAQGGGGSSGDYMKDFFGDVEIVKANIHAIKEASKKVVDIDENAMQATTSDRETDLSNELEPLIKATNKKASIAKQILQRLREDTESMKKSNSNSKQTPEIRIRDNLANTLTRKFVDVMKEYQNAQTKYRNDIKMKVKRQVQIVKPDATTEEIDAVFKSGGGSGEILKNVILKGEASDSIQNAFMNAKDKYQDVLTLEKSVAELHQMFLDFALLTEQQGELLDQIEHQVKEAGDHIDAGNVEMVQAIELAKAIRYKQCLIALIILVVLGIIVGIIAAKVSGAF